VAAMDSLINTQLGQYRLVEVIGRGSTSVVYKAWQASLNRFVAVKVLLRNLDPQLASRFWR
jgi:serine/threonine-protein kinase